MEQNTLENAASGSGKLPSGINVLTILTFVGSGLAAIGALWGYATIGTSYKLMQSMESSVDSAGESSGMGKMMTESMMTIVKKSYDNRMIIMLFGLLGAALCIYGAMQMRKLKKQGYFIWLGGEIIPVIVNFALVGFGFFGGFMMLGLIFPVLFIILYSLQLKHLK